MIVIVVIVIMIVPMRVIVVIVGVPMLGMITVLVCSIFMLMIRGFVRSMILMGKLVAHSRKLLSRS